MLLMYAYGYTSRTREACISPEKKDTGRQRVRVEVISCSREFVKKISVATSISTSILQCFTELSGPDFLLRLQYNCTRDNPRPSVPRHRCTNLRRSATIGTIGISLKLKTTSNGKDAVSDTPRKARRTVTGTICAQAIYGQTTCFVQTTHSSITLNRNRQQYRWLDVLCHGTGMSTRGRANE
jgi:hypothetical protein